MAEVLKDRGKGILDFIIDAINPVKPAYAPDMNYEMMRADTGFSPVLETIVAQDVMPDVMLPPIDIQADRMPMMQLPERPEYASVDLMPQQEAERRAMYNRLRGPGYQGIGRGEGTPQSASERQAIVDMVNKQTVRNQPQEAGLLSRIGGGLGSIINDPITAPYVMEILNQMRNQPNKFISQMNLQRIESARETEKTNRTADVLLDRGLIDKEQADAIRIGALSYKDVLGGEGIAKYRWLLDNPEAAAKLKELGAIGGGTNITIGDKGETKLQEEIGKGLGTKITEDFNAGTQARSALDSVELLMGLSENLESATSIPPALRNLVPEGLSDPIDAYRGVMTNVAKSLRIKGEGTMSDRDIDLLIRQAGPVTSNPQARRVMQEALKRKAEINLQLSKAASDLMLERINRQQYLDRVNDINNIPLMDERMRSYISSLGGGAAKPAGGQVKVISVE